MVVQRFLEDESGERGPFAGTDVEPLGQGRVRPLGPLSAAVMGLFALGALADAWAGLLLHKMSALLEASPNAGPSTLLALQQRSDQFDDLGWVSLGLLVLGVVALLVWLHRASSNQWAWGAQARYTPGHAVVSWFIPVMQLWRVPQVVSELARNSQLRAEPGSRTGAAVALVWAWWIVALGDRGLTRAVERDLARADDLDALTAALDQGVFVSGLSIVAGALTLTLVWRVSAWQRAGRGRG